MVSSRRVVVLVVVAWAMVSMSVHAHAQEVDPDGLILEVVAGGLGRGPANDGGPASDASLLTPAGVAVDDVGNIYVADAQSHRVRVIDSDGVIRGFAGNGVAGFSGDGGPALAAQLNRPHGLAVSPDGTVYIADNQNRRIRAVDPSGNIHTVVGGGSLRQDEDIDGRSAVEIPLIDPWGVATDRDGNLYLTDPAANFVARVDRSGIVQRLAGQGHWAPVSGPLGDGGPASDAFVNAPLGITVSDTGTVLFTDAGNGRIRAIDAAGRISTVAGDGEFASDGDGGPATAASLARPSDIAVHGDRILVAETSGSRVRLIREGMITTIAGNGTEGTVGEGGPAGGAMISRPNAIDVSAGGDVYVTDSITRRLLRIGPAGRPVATWYTHTEASTIATAADYLGLSSAEFQKTGVAVLRFINALAGNTGTAALGSDAPSSTGPVSFESRWDTSDQEILNWVNSYYVIDAATSQKVGATLLYFLASIDARSKGTELPS